MFNRNPSRTLNSGIGTILSEPANIARQSSMSGDTPTLHRAVVMEIVVNPNDLTDEYKTQLSTLVNNKELIEVMPTNAVIGRIISTNQGLIQAQDTILFPFFSSHIMMPISVGEIVYVIYEDYQNLGNKIGYWLTRQHGQATVEDVNYTHNDRMYDPRNNLYYWTTEDKSSIESLPAPDFPNGGVSSTANTLTPINNQNPYDVLYRNAIATKLTSPEPVPRWNKRPQELVFQGANNTLIMLGEDRYGHVSGAIDKKVNGIERTDIKGFAGTVDIIAGRGRKIQTTPNTIGSDPANAATAPASTSPDDPLDTAPRVIQNTRGNFETDKAPFRQKAANNTRKKDNSKEGNPDFQNDAARLLITMQSQVDDNFGLTQNGDSPLTYPTETKPIIQPEATTVSNLSGSFNRSYVVGKGDHIRFIARKDDNLNVDGSILLIKEGSRQTKEKIRFGPDEGTETEQSEDLAYIYITPEGEIQISAKKIYISPGSNNEEEPYVLWSKYAESIGDIQDQIANLAAGQSSTVKGLADAMGQLLTLLSTIFASSNVCPPGGPNPALTAAATAITTVWSSTVGQGSANLGTAIEQILTELQKSQNDNLSNNVAKEKHSKIVFGG